MSDTQEIDYRHELYKRFDLQEHEIREGGKSGERVQWFIYVNREPIQARLDKLFFMNWTLTYSLPNYGADYVSVSAAITINNVTREYSGGQGLNGSKSVGEDTVKGAYTDAFKRAASMWGMGLYLQYAPKIFTAGYTKGDWTTRRAREDEAWAQFVAWYEGKSVASPKVVEKTGDKASTSPATLSSTNGTSQHSQAPQSTSNGVEKHYACSQMTILKRGDNEYQYIAKCGHNLNIVTYTRDLYRQALGEKVESWNVDVSPKGKVLKFEQDLQLVAVTEGQALKLIRVIG